MAADVDPEPPNHPRHLRPRTTHHMADIGREAEGIATERGRGIETGGRHLPGTVLTGVVGEVAMEGSRGQGP